MANPQFQSTVPFIPFPSASRPMSQTKRLRTLCGWLMMIACCAGYVHAAKPLPEPGKSARYGEIALSFERNQGQADPGVQYLARGQGYGIFLTPTDTILALERQTPAKDRRAVPPPPQTSLLRMTLLGARGDASPVAVDPLPGTSNYLLGQSRITDVPTFAKVRYANVYPGVDVIHYGNHRQLEYDFVVAPNANASAIALGFWGGKPTLDANGNLEIATNTGATCFQKPTVYQVIGGARVPVEASYILVKQKVTFALGPYDHSVPLIIDPVLTYATYLGGSLYDNGTGIAADASGNAYIVGDTVSTNFPLVNAYQSTNHDTSNGFVAFVTKLNPAGTAAVYSTFLGGVSDTHAMGVAVDTSGSAYVVGYTSASDYPVTSGAFQTICGANYTSTMTGRVRSNGCSPSSGNTSGFITKLSPSGTSLSYSTFLSGDAFNQVTAIAVDAAGEAYVVGNTNAFCGVPPYYPTNPYGADAYDCFPVTSTAYMNGTLIGGGGTTNFTFFTKLSADGSTLLYSTILGPAPGTNGTGNLLSMGLNAVAVDPSGNAYVAGYAGYGAPTTSGAFYVPPVNSSTALPPYPAYVAKINPAASGSTSLIYATFLGSAAQTANASNYSNTATGIAADASGNAYVGGYVNECGYPTTTGAYETTSAFTPGGYCSDGFVTKVNPTGTGLVWSTLIGTPVGTSATNSTINSLALGTNGNIYVAGTAGGGTYPQVGTLKPGVNGGAVLSEVDATGSKLLFSSYVSGYNTDQGQGIAVDSSGNMYVTGRTYAGGATSIPTTTGALQTSYQGGSYDAFVVKIVPTIVSTTTVTIPTGTVIAGQPVTLSATVSGPGGTTSIPTGTVTFLSGSTTLGTGTLNGSGTATYAATSLNATTYNVTASYPGDTNFAASVSSPKSLVVSPATPTVTLTAPATAVVGASVTLSVTVAGSGATPSGTVTFKDGSSTLSTATLSAGAASYSTSSLATGAHSITVSYSGDSIFAATTSAASTVTINVAPAISFSVAPPSLTITHGSSGSVMITATPVGGYTGTVTFSCGTLPTAASCVFAPTTLTFSGNNVAQSSTLNISTVMTAALELPKFGAHVGGIVAAFLLCPLGLGLRRRNRRWGTGVLLALCILSSVALLSATGCAGGPKSVTTPAGSYTVVVTASATGSNNSINIPLTVQ